METQSSRVRWIVSIQTSENATRMCVTVSPTSVRLPWTSARSVRRPERPGVRVGIVEAQSILAEADSRDDRADARDSEANDRERAASLDLFVHPNDEYDAAIKARRLAAMDRLNSKSDRSSSAHDRSKLSESDRPATMGDDESV